MGYILSLLHRDCMLIANTKCDLLLSKAPCLLAVSFSSHHESFTICVKYLLAMCPGLTFCQSFTNVMSVAAKSVIQSKDALRWLSSVPLSKKLLIGISSFSKCANMLHSWPPSLHQSRPEWASWLRWLTQPRRSTTWRSWRLASAAVMIPVD